MVVVVQLLTSDEYAPGTYICTRIVNVKIPVTNIMPDAIYNARGKEWDPNHLNRPNRNAYGAK